MVGQKVFLSSVSSLRCSFVRLHFYPPHQTTVLSVTEYPTACRQRQGVPQNVPGPTVELKLDHRCRHLVDSRSRSMPAGL